MGQGKEVIRQSQRKYTMKEGIIERDSEVGMASRNASFAVISTGRNSVKVQSKCMLFLLCRSGACGCSE
jgi:hypothetical protein